MIDVLLIVTYGNRLVVQDDDELSSLISLRWFLIAWVEAFFTEATVVFFSVSEFFLHWTIMDGERRRSSRYMVRNMKINLNR